MPTEAMQFANLIERITREIVAQIDGLNDDIMNQAPPFPGSNTLAALATHSVGMGEFWVLSLVGGRNIARDRPAEFRAQGSALQLARRYEGWIADTHALLDPLPDAAMSRVVEPPAAFRGPELPAVMTVRDCLLHVVEHTANHLGHMQVTRDWLLLHR